MGFTDALIASEKGGRPVTGATPGYNYPAEEMISGVEPGVVGPSTNKSSLDQLFSNIGAIMPSGIGAETRQADEIVKARARAAAAGYGQADTGGVPTQTPAQIEAPQAALPEVELLTWCCGASTSAWCSANTRCTVYCRTTT
jgi:hypothetical protein